MMTTRAGDCWLRQATLCFKLAAGLALLLNLTAHAETAAQAYRSKCSTCHDSGAGLAPRLSDTAQWQALARQGRTALYQGAINGKPNTPMAPKGGFASLSDAETRAIVDYMLAASGNANAPLAAVLPAAGPALLVPNAAAASPALAAAGTAISATDEALSQIVAERLLAALGKPEMRLDPYQGVITIRGIGIKVETQQGVTILAGVLHDASLIARAEALAAAVPGVTRIVNRMVSGAMLDFD
jgi:cytochrome c5